jgi:hypothetical protein
MQDTGSWIGLGDHQKDMKDGGENSSSQSTKSFQQKKYHCIFIELLHGTIFTCNYLLDIVFHYPCIIRKFLFSLEEQYQPVVICNFAFSLGYT